MKKILILALAVLLLMPLTACQNGAPTHPIPQAPATTPNNQPSTTQSAAPSSQRPSSTPAATTIANTTVSIQDASQSKTEATLPAKTTKKPEITVPTSTKVNDKYGSVMPSGSFDDNRQPGVQDSFVATPPKYTKDEFVARLMAYINGRTPDQSYLYGEADRIPKDEKKFVEEYYIKDFAENHEFNLLLHKTNSCQDQWITIEKWDYQFTDQVVYTIGVSYTITCNTLAEATALAKNDAYRLAPFCQLSSSQVVYSLMKQGLPKVTAVSKLTDTDFEKLAQGEYHSITANPEAGALEGYSCHFTTDITLLPNSQYEYNAGVSLQIRN